MIARPENLKPVRDGRRLYVAIYLRKSPASKDAIESSIEQQREAIRKYCDERGWKIVEEYCDGGKSGSRDQDERHDYIRMIDDARKGEWSAVVVWHTNRFARLDILDVAEDVRKLRAAGVHIESVKQGTIDATTQQGRMALFMNSETDSGFARNVSADSLRGRVTKIHAGNWPHGRVPFGYDREFYENGEIKHRVTRSEKFVKPGNWSQKLVVNDAEAVVVRWFFETFAYADVSLRWLAREANRKGFLTPTGKAHWSMRSVNGVLSNPVYKGDIAMGFKPGTKKGAFNQADPISSPQAPKIVKPETWEVVAQKIADRKGLATHPKTDRCGVLSGVVVCGGCGYNLVAKGKKTGRVYYICNSATVRPSCACPQWRAHESELLPQIIEALVASIDGELLRSIMAKPDASSPDQRPAIIARLKELEASVAQGVKNLVRVSNPDLYPLVEAELEKVKAELDKAQNTLAIIDGRGDKSEAQKVLDWWTAAKDGLIKIKSGTPISAPKVNGRAVFRPADVIGVVDLFAKPEAVRDLLKKLNTRVILSWTPNGKRYHKLEKGVLTADFGEHLLSGNRSTRC